MSRRVLEKNIGRKILREVIKEAYKDGLSGVSTAKVAHSLGISEPVIFTHFGSKKNLIKQAFFEAWRPFEPDGALPVLFTGVGITKEREGDFYLITKEAMKRKREIAYMTEYLTTPAHFEPEVAYELFAKKRENIKAYVGERLSPRDGYPFDQVLAVWLCNFFAFYSHLAHGHYLNKPLEVAKAYNELLFGIEGALTID